MLDSIAGQFPYQVSLQYYSGGWIHYCGGTILDENHVLTAGQCHPVPGDLAVAGITDLLSPGFEVQARTITRVVPHPEYFGSVTFLSFQTL
ncbi:unnamed protein product [Darwinula stevensoni]|uniref:Peptidase S1 domain-containing protein n=1 Tax=Darwinula stevensoni TaxID=69355 RepID=A0A7R9FU08_9CRUS|nr:unnamed protein product [Darwinula stevensoni]CAG0906606.1 unnamed protein product [Darwinula stevensoni]